MNTEKSKLIVYGANGYSAGLIIEELRKNNIRPILSGRNESSIEITAQEYGCDYVSFDLKNKQNVAEHLRQYHTLLNCAGPFKNTAEILIDTCLSTSTNYLDITGEIPVIEYAWENDRKAKEKNIVIMPSIGFDVIPTDCLSKRLVANMPDAINLELGIRNKKGKISKGTFLTTLEMVCETGKIRKDQKIVDSFIGEYSIDIKGKRFRLKGISIPWGDVASAYYSTGIPNIIVYLGLPYLLYLFRRPLLMSMKLLKIKFVENFIRNYVNKMNEGPTKKERDAAEVFVWGRVTNKKNEKYEEAYKIIEGYNLTSLGGADIVKRILNNEVDSGTKTPSLAFGSSFMDRFVIERLY